MNRALFVFFTLFIFACTPKSYSPLQENFTVHQSKYKDQLEEGSKFLYQGYQFTVEKLVSGEFVEKTYFPDTRQMTHYVTFSDRNLRIKNGQYIEYWDDGTLSKKGNYVDNKRSGEWVVFVSSNKTKGNYLAGKKDGPWITLDTTNNKVAEYLFANGELNGAFKRWDHSGQLKSEGVYENGELAWKKEYDENIPEKDPEIFKIVEVLPRYPSAACDALEGKAQKECSERAMLKYIYGSIKYPAKAREESVEGMALVSFVVEKNGTVTEVVCRRGLCKEIKEECLRVVNNMPVWHPGMQGGKPVRVFFNLPIRFRLE